MSAEITIEEQDDKHDIIHDGITDDKNQSNQLPMIIEPHNDKPITMMEISPNAKYLVTFSKEDQTIVGWNVENIKEGKLKLDRTIETEVGDISHICVSDEKKLAFINSYYYIGKYDDTLVNFYIMFKYFINESFHNQLIY